MINIEFDCQKYFDAEESARRGEIVLKENALGDVWDSYRLYEEQYREIDERTMRVLIIPKNEHGSDTYDCYPWEDTTYETGWIIMFHIPYNEMCLIRKRLLGYGLELDDFYEETAPKYIREIDKLIEMIEGCGADETINILKRSKEYPYGCIFDEENIM